MKRSKLESYLGLARRAGKLTSGYQACLHNVQKGKVRLIIVAEDSADNTKDKFSTLCKKYNISFEIFGTIEALSSMTGFSGRGVYGIEDDNFAQVVIKEIQNEKVMLSM